MTSLVVSNWAELFDQAQKIIDQANSRFPVLDSWTFGGGTALMLQIDHRESFDVDIFIDDPQILPYLNPQTQGYALDPNPDGYHTDGSRALKLIFDGLGEIDFIAAGALTSDPTVAAEVRGRMVMLETAGEIVAKKIFYRGASMQPRDMFDIACVRRYFGDEYLVDTLAPFTTESARALDAARNMDPAFAQALMERLLCRPAYKSISSAARQSTIELLEKVLLHEPGRAAKAPKT